MVFSPRMEQEYTVGPACFPFLGYLRAKSRLTAVALRNAPAGAVPHTPFTRKGYAASVKRHSR